MFDIQEQLKNLPDCPGVYMHKDSLGKIIYVGKAISLKNRVRQYFQSSRNMDPKVRSMVSQIAEFEYITAGSEVEALILECNLIKKYRPKYNILLRDDKTYPYIKITNEPWPRLIKTRQILKDGARYFGPYSDAGAVNRIVDLLNSTFALKRCSAVAFPKGFRPCLNYHINQCRGICDGGVDAEEYAKAIDGAADFLRGQSKELTKRLKEKMQAASEAMDYEEAAIYRDHLEAAKALMETQRVVMHHSKEADILIPIRSEGGAHVALFFVRDGKLVGRESFEIETDNAVDIDEGNGGMLAAFIKQHYSRMTDIPKEILLTVMPDDHEILEGFLRTQAGHSVALMCPRRGEKKALVDLAGRDAAEMTKTIDDRARNARDRRDNLNREIYEILRAMGVKAEKGREYRIEAYDISNTNGVDTVGAMVTFQGLRADKKGYRKFRIRSIEGQDDYGAMNEVLSRRFNRLFQGDDGFSVLPDIIFMDGGKGHVSTALEVIDVTGFDIPVIGMVKDDSHRTRALVYRDQRGEFVELPLEGRPLLFKYIGRIQEEVHRFAIDYHRKLRNKSTQKSVLDDIPGIGPKRRNDLLRTFKSVEEIRRIACSDNGRETLARAGSMDRLAADKVCRYFRGES